MDGTDEAAVSLRFVLPKGKTETSCSEALSYAFETSQDNGLSPEWITHDETLQINPVKTVTFAVFLLMRHVAVTLCTLQKSEIIFDPTRHGQD